MPAGFVARVSVALVAAATAASGTLAVLAAQAQLPASERRGVTGPAARTSWGDPDLQGTWSYGILTPLERPAATAAKEFVTEAEAAEINLEEAALKDRPTRPGDTGAYNRYWMDIRRVHAERRTSLITDPPDGKLPFNEESRKNRAARAAYLRDNPADSWVDRSLQERCLVYHGIPPVPSNYNNHWQIFQTPGHLVILAENIHDVRVIPLDGRPHLSPAVRQWHGDSRGRWEGQTLVVETTNYKDRSAMSSASATGSTSEQTRAIERFTRIDADTIDYRYTIEDLKMFTRPWTVALPLARTTDSSIYEYACNEGNHALGGILKGARAVERATQR